MSAWQTQRSAERCMTSMSAAGARSAAAQSALEGCRTLCKSLAHRNMCILRHRAAPALLHLRRLVLADASRPLNSLVSTVQQAASACPNSTRHGACFRLHSNLARSCPRFLARGARRRRRTTAACLQAVQLALQVLAVFVHGVGLCLQRGQRLLVAAMRCTPAGTHPVHCCLGVCFMTGRSQDAPSRAISPCSIMPQHRHPCAGTA